MSVLQTNENKFKHETYVTLQWTAKNLNIFSVRNLEL